VLIATVLIGVYRYHVDRGCGSTRRMIKALVYCFIVTTGVLFVHNYAIVQCALRHSSDQGVRDVFLGIDGSRAIGPSVPVLPEPTREVFRIAGSGEPCRACDEGRADNVDRSSGETGASLMLRDVIVPTATALR
jgi:hypothetical protein